VAVPVRSGEFESSKQLSFLHPFLPFGTSTQSLHTGPPLHQSLAAMAYIAYTALQTRRRRLYIPPMGKVLGFWSSRCPGPLFFLLFERFKYVQLYNHSFSFRINFLSFLPKWLTTHSPTPVKSVGVVLKNVGPNRAKGRNVVHFEVLFHTLSSISMGTSTSFNYWCNTRHLQCQWLL
jgi:hypothetical protein